MGTGIGIGISFSTASKAAETLELATGVKRGDAQQQAFWGGSSSCKFTTLKKMVAAQGCLAGSRPHVQACFRSIYQKDLLNYSLISL